MKLIYVYLIGILLAFGLGFYVGQQVEKSKHQSIITQSKQTLDQHEKQMQIISNEPDSLAIDRFHGNFGSGNK